MPDTTLTWLGHATFRFDTPGGKRVYVDPFLNGNPKCPESEVDPERVDTVFFTGGSSGVASLRERIAAIVPDARRVEGDLFGSIGAGLAIDAARKFG